MLPPVAGASVPPVCAVLDPPIRIAGSSSACLIALTCSSVDSIDITRVFGSHTPLLSS